MGRRGGRSWGIIGRGRRAGAGRRCGSWRSAADGDVRVGPARVGGPAVVAVSPLHASPRLGRLGRRLAEQGPRIARAGCGRTACKEGPQIACGCTMGSGTALSRLPASAIKFQRCGVFELAVAGSGRLAPLQSVAGCCRVRRVLAAKQAGKAGFITSRRELTLGGQPG